MACGSAFATPRSSCRSPTASMSSSIRTAARTVASIARIAPEDAEAYARYDAYTTEIARIVGGFMLQPQPSMAEFAAAFTGANGPDLLNCGAVRQHCRLSRSASSSPTTSRARWPMARCRAPTRAPTPRYGLLEVLPCRGRSRRPIRQLGDRRRRDGLGHQGAGEPLRAHGGEIRLEAPVAQILYRRGRAAGVVLDNGDEIEADAVLANLVRRTATARVRRPRGARPGSRRPPGDLRRCESAAVECRQSPHRASDL